MTLKEINSSLLQFHSESVDSISKAIADASTRCYYRLFLKDKTSIILCDYSKSADKTAADFIQITNVFQEKSIVTAKILGYDKSSRWMFLSDLGSEDLQSYLKNNPTEEMAKLKSCLELLVAIQKIHPPEIVAKRLFDTTKLYAEMEFLFTQLSKSNIETPTLIRQEMYRLCQRLSHPSRSVFCHRDYHSRNIFITAQGLALIDYQDARMGSPHYDAVSIIFDPYIKFDVKRIETLSNYWLQHFSNSKEEQDFYSQALQRLLKALGTYLYQVNTMGNEKFKDSLAQVEQSIYYVAKALKHPSIANFIKHVSGKQKGLTLT